VRNYFRMGFVCGLLILLLLSTTQVPNMNAQSIYSDDWPTHRHDNFNTGYTERHNAPIDDDLVVFWRYHAESETPSPPALATIQGNNLAFLGTKAGKLHCIDALTKEKKWIFPDNFGNVASYGSILATPTIHDNKVFFGTMTGNVFCLDAFTGNVEWQQGVRGAINGAVKANEKYLFFGTHEGYIYCLDVTCGNILWAYFTQYPITGSAALGFNRLWMSCSGNKLYSFFQNGELVHNWPVRYIAHNGKPTNDMEADPIYFNDKIAISANYPYVFDYITGSLYGNTANQPVDVESSIAISPPYTTSSNRYAIYYIQSARNKLVKAVEPDFYNNLFWNTTKPLETAGLASTPSIAGDRIYLAGQKVYAIDANNGKIVYESGYDPSNQPTASVFTQISIANGLIYTCCENGDLYAIGSKNHDHGCPPCPGEEPPDPDECCICIPDVYLDVYSECVCITQDGKRYVIVEVCDCCEFQLTFRFYCPQTGLPLTEKQLRRLDFTISAFVNPPTHGRIAKIEGPKIHNNTMTYTVTYQALKPGQVTLSIGNSLLIPFNDIHITNIEKQ